jgi:hypothetical protein
LRVSSVAALSYIACVDSLVMPFFVFSVTGQSWWSRGSPRPVFIRLQLVRDTPITRTDCMYAHLRSGFCKSGLPISRLTRPSVLTITTTASSSNPYPYPPHSNPTAHQIFHLPSTASQKEVKSRCLHRYAIDTPLM